MSDIIQYIITFLLYGNDEAAKQVGYTADESQWSNYRVVVVPNGHLGKEIVIPELSEVKGERLEVKGSENTTWIIRTDIVYNTFFFISRAEELLNTQRDEHDRFLAKYSILGKNNRLMIPTVDEYARMLMKLLDLHRILNTLCGLKPCVRLYQITVINYLQKPLTKVALS